MEMRWCCTAGGPPPKPRDLRVGAGVGVCQNDKHAVLRSTVLSVREGENKFSVHGWAALGRSPSFSLAVPFARLSRRQEVSVEWTPASEAVGGAESPVPGRPWPKST